MIWFSSYKSTAFMRKRAKIIFCIFEKKKKGEELTKGSTWPLSSIETRHPHPSGGNMTGGAGTSSSSGKTVTGGPMGLLPPADPQQWSPVVGL
jgi:hypothetical protein